MNGHHTHCQLCNTPIHEGELYGVLVFNIEVLSTGDEENLATIDVLKSKNVSVMCMKCSSKYNNENIHSLLD